MGPATLQRYIAYNVVLWLAVAVAAAVLLATTRQYGVAMTVRHAARQLLHRADALYLQSPYESRTALMDSLATDPGIVAEAIGTMGPRLLGMPGINEALEQAMKASKDNPALAQAQYRILLGYGSAVGSLLQSAQARRGAPREIERWLGQLALDDGDIFVAQKHFAKFWKGKTSERAEVESRIRSGSSADEEARAGRELFVIGLWDEAFGAFEAARNKGAADPDLPFYEGVQHELNENDAAAVSAYRAVLSRLPTHRLALVRLAGFK